MTKIPVIFIENIKKRYLGLILTFLVYLAAVIFASYLYREVGTAPAVMFTTHGIALAAFIILGYTAALPVALAALILGISIGTPSLLIVANVLATALQPAITLFLLRKIGFNKTLETTRDFVALLLITGVTSTIAPTSTVLSRQLFNSFVGTTNTFSWMHLWIGVLLSCFILTPFVLRWAVPVRKRTVPEWVEIFAVLSLFVVTNYILSFTPITVVYGISLAIPYFLLLLWLALRAGSRFITLAMLLTTCISFSGLFLGIHAPTEANLKPITDRIYSTEIILICIALFYYIMCSVEERRRAVVRELAIHTENLKNALTEKEIDEKAKNEFIAILGHEIRNPLAAILSSVELLKIKSNDAVERERLLEGVEDRIRSMARLLDDIFDISRITRRKLHLKTELVRARDVLRGATESVEGYMLKNKHQFSVHLPDRNVVIKADPVRVEQIVTNLLYNAAKYTPSGGSIEFRGSYENDSRTPGTGQLVLRVRDTGVGLTEEEQDKIFEPFMQINPKHSLMGGIGLGLTLARNLVEMHNGTIEVQSDGLGRGSEFIVRIPASIGTPPPKKIPETPAPTTDFVKILVVDDNADAAKGMSKLLELHGHDTQVALTGNEALEKARAYKPHGIVLDIGLPDIDGYEVARRLREEKFTCTLIALSGYGHDDHKRTAREAGFDFFLTKPVSITEVVKIVHNASSKEVQQNKSANGIPNPELSLNRRKIDQ